MLWGHTAVCPPLAWKYEQNLILDHPELLYLQCPGVIGWWEKGALRWHSLSDIHYSMVVSQMKAAKTEWFPFGLFQLAKDVLLTYLAVYSFRSFGLLFPLFIPLLRLDGLFSSVLVVLRWEKQWWRRETTLLHWGLQSNNRSVPTDDAFLSRKVNFKVKTNFKKLHDVRHKTLSKQRFQQQYEMLKEQKAIKSKSKWNKSRKKCLITGIYNKSNNWFAYCAWIFTSEYSTLTVMLKGK